MECCFRLQLVAAVDEGVRALAWDVRQPTAGEAEWAFPALSSKALPPPIRRTKAGPGHCRARRKPVRSDVVEPQNGDVYAVPCSPRLLGVPAQLVHHVLMQLRGKYPQPVARPRTRPISSNRSRPVTRWSQAPLSVALDSGRARAPAGLGVAEDPGAATSAGQGTAVGAVSADRTGADPRYAHLALVLMGSQDGRGHACDTREGRRVIGVRGRPTGTGGGKGFFPRPFTSPLRVSGRIGWSHPYVGLSVRGSQESRGGVSPGSNVERR